jgi:hypothetical protein
MEKFQLRMRSNNWISYTQTHQLWICNFTFEKLFNQCLFVDGPKWTNTHECNDGCTKHDTFFFHCVLCSPSNLLFIVQDSKLVPTLPKLRFIQLNGLQMGNGMVHSRKFSSVQFSSVQFTRAYWWGYYAKDKWFLPLFPFSVLGYYLPSFGYYLLT